jgi:hypothetical protein
MPGDCGDDAGTSPRNSNEQIILCARTTYHRDYGLVSVSHIWHHDIELAQARAGHACKLNH